jgi:hypothetical protein
VRFITGRQSLDGTSVCYRDAWEAVHPGVRGETFSATNPLLADWDWPFKRASPRRPTASGRATTSASSPISNP